MLQTQVRVLAVKLSQAGSFVDTQLSALDTPRPFPANPIPKSAFDNPVGSGNIHDLAALVEDHRDRVSLELR